MIKRLRAKFIIINMVIVTAMLCVIFALVISFMGLGMEMQSRRLMEQIGDVPFRPSVHKNDKENTWRPHFLVRIGADGHITVSAGANYEDLDEELVRSCTRKALTESQEFGMLKEYNLRYHKREVPSGQSILFLDISGEMDTMKGLVQVCALIGVASFSVFFVISVLLANWAVKPVETAWDQQRQFVADASHELKTPLTVIMTNAELLQSPEYSETQRSQFVFSILTMSRQMRGLVESLLELARLDSGGSKKEFSKVHFSELVCECLLPFEPVYFEKELLLNSGIEEQIHIRGNEAQLRQVLDILLDNAAKYSHPGGEVAVRLKRNGSTCLLSVSNPGETISRENLKQIFERFYRVDKARSMNHSYGLGLPIARQIVAEHGGKIWAESREGINTFSVQFTIV